jgi:GAF domain-containing protein/nitrogen-specific signal transduction histidine kinase
MVEPTATIDGRKKTPRRPRKAQQPNNGESTLAARLRDAETERDEALAQQAATAEILDLINRSSGDPAPVFEAIVERAMRLCDAPFGGLLVPDGEYLRYLALGNAPPRFNHFLTHERIRLNTMLGPGVLAGETLHIVDLIKEEGYRRRVPVTVSAVEDGGIRSLLCTPLMKDGTFVGAFTLYRQEVRPFTARQIALARSFADQAAIAMENARLLTETREALDRQTATAEVLEVINASPGDLAPVFDTILDRALRLCGASLGALCRYDGVMMRLAAEIGASPEAAKALRTVAPDPGSAVQQLVDGAPFVHIADIADSDAYRSGMESRRKFVELTGARTALWLALRKDDALLGVVIVYRREVRPFLDKHVALLQNFAAQAVIAIENARLLDEINARNRDLTQSLERQTATSDILGAIAASPGDAERTLKKIAETTSRLFGAAGVSFRIAEGDEFKVSIGVGRGAEQISSQLYSDPAKRPTVSGRNLPAAVIRENRQIDIPDLGNLDPELADWPGLPVARAAGIHVMVGTPLRAEGHAIGALMVYRDEPRPLDPVELHLLQSFADQAVIAIENARLLTELRVRTADLQQSLEYQTATSDVLKVISRTTFDLTPVLQYVLDTAMRLCHAVQGSIFRLDGVDYRWAVGKGLDPVYEEIERTTPIAPGEGTLVGRAAVRRQTVQIADAWEDPLYAPKDDARITVARTMLGVPLLREGSPIGVIAMARKEVRPFTDKEVELVTTFADQAVIAIENARLLTELRESLEQQQAIAEVLQVINASPGNLAPVFDAILDKAHTLCGASRGSLFIIEGDTLRAAATRGYPADLEARLRESAPLAGGRLFAPLLDGARLVHHPDLLAIVPSDNPMTREVVARGAVRTNLILPLRKDNALLGFISCNRAEVRPFAESDIALLESFAAQAVIAMDNARLLTELRESLEQQQAIAELLQVINASPGNLAPVFDAILDKAHSLCGANIGWLLTFDGELVRMQAQRGLIDLDPAVASAPFLPGPAMRRLIDGESFFQIPDISEAKDSPGTPLIWRVSCELLGTGNYLIVPLSKDGTVHGFINAFHSPIRPFSEKEITLLQSFAAQAVIAMDNARLLGEIRQRQAELRVTFENMGDAVIMFDGAQRLVAWNRNFLHMLDIPEEWLASPRNYTDFAAYLTARGEFGDTAPPDLDGPDGAGDVRPIRYERTRPDGRVLEVRRNPIPGGAGFVFIYSDATERKRAEQSILAAREAAERALTDLKLAQANLVQAEKMASLGQLTAGIAHEIKNPLNFVNNFANLSNELLGELKEAAAPAFATLDADSRDEIDETMEMLTGNLEKIQEHGKRADGIVKSMLAHSRGGSGDRREADVNALVEESLNLAYHGARAQDQNFNITLERDYDKTMKPMELVPQDVTRVFLNLCGNGFYAANKRRKEGGDSGFRPVLKVATRDLGDAVEVRIRDNGTGIPPAIKDKLFQPFFTTKPTGEGTGLGLSISYDIVTQQHGGTIAVDSRVGDFTEFTIHLPRKH